MKVLSIIGHNQSRVGTLYLNSPKYKAIYRKLEIEIEEKVKTGYEYILTGGGIGVDFVAFLVVEKLKKKYSNLKNVLVLPYKKHEVTWSDYNKRLYYTIKRKADMIIHVDRLKDYNHNLENLDYYASFKHRKRGEYLVDNCNHIICLWDLKEYGMTYYTMRYAIKKGANVQIININTI